MKNPFSEIEFFDEINCDFINNESEIVYNIMDIFENEQQQMYTLELLLSLI